MERPPPPCPPKITTSTAAPRVPSVVPSARRMSARVALASSGRPRSTFQHPVAFSGAWKRLGFALTGPVTDCQSIAASFNLLSSLAYAFDCSATCGFVCAVDGADYALTDRDLSAGGTCSFGMTAVDVPVLRVGSSTPRLLVLTKMKEPTTRSARKKKVNVDLRCRDTGAELPRSRDLCPQQEVGHRHCR